MSKKSSGDSSSKQAEKERRAQKGRELLDFYHEYAEDADASFSKFNLPPGELAKMLLEGREYVGCRMR